VGGKGGEGRDQLIGKEHREDRWFLKKVTEGMGGAESIGRAWLDSLMNVEGGRKEAGRHEEGEGLGGKRGDGRRHQAKGHLSRFLGT